MGKPGLSAVSSDPGKVIVIYYMYCITYNVIEILISSMASPHWGGRESIRLGGEVAIVGTFIMGKCCLCILLVHTL